jgi:hypothetical protein
MMLMPTPGRLLPRRRIGQEISFSLQGPAAVGYLYTRRELDLPILEVESVRQPCADSQLIRCGHALADRFFEKRQVKEGRPMAFHEPGRDAFPVDRVPWVNLPRDAFDWDVWMHETAGLGDATPLHDSFPGARDGLGRVVSSGQLGLGGRHGF